MVIAKRYIGSFIKNSSFGTSSARHGVSCCYVFFLLLLIFPNPAFSITEPLSEPKTWRAIDTIVVLTDDYFVDPDTGEQLALTVTAAKAEVLEIFR